MKRLFIGGASWLFQLLVVSGALLALFVALTPQGRASFHAVLFVSQVLELPVRPQAWFTDEPFRHEAHYPSSRGASAAHVYRLPDGEPRAAVVLSLGVTAEGLEDPLVVNLGNALARAGIVVMFDWSPDMGQGYQLDPNEPDNLVSAFLYLEGQEYVDRERVALGGFCVGASVALVAAPTPESATGCIWSMPSVLTSTPGVSCSRRLPAPWYKKARERRGNLLLSQCG